METLLIAGITALTMSGPAFSGDSMPALRDAQLTRPEPLLLAQRRTPDTTTPGSTSPGHSARVRPAYSTQQEQYYAAELRKCETMGDTTERLACKNSVRNKFGEM